MATIVQNKKTGGPYTQDEQRKRRNEVYRLHFEYGYSARKISEIISVNRNTVNEDIKYLYSQISSDLKSNNIAENFGLKQYDRLENQRGRLLVELEKQENLRDKILIEKMILDIDGKISNLIMQIRPEITEKIQPNP